MGDITYPRVDGVLFIHGAFQKGDAIFLPRKAAKKILVFKGWRFERIFFRKRSPEDRKKLRYQFDVTVRPSYLKLLASTKREQLRGAGLTDRDIKLMERGMVPPKYQVHHIIPLDDGGDNAYDNLILIRTRCEHSALTAYQNTFTKGLAPDDEVEIDYPVPIRQSDFAVYPPSVEAPVELTLWPRRNAL